MSVETVCQRAEQIADALRRLRDWQSLPPELQALRHLAPSHAEPHVTLEYDEAARKVRSKVRSDAAAEKYWDWSKTQLQVRWTARTALESEDAASAEPNASEDPLDEFLRALDEAESDPKKNYVVLKWLRDSYLPQRSYQWAGQPADRDRMIRRATELGLALTSKVPNPQNPQFPTTTIRLNRSHERVQRVIGRSSASSRFRRIPIRGKPLSETVIESRR